MDNLKVDERILIYPIHLIVSDPVDRIYQCPFVDFSLNVD